MNKNTLMNTNLIVCSIITIGFIATSIIGYRSNTDIFRQDAEYVSTLASDGIYYQIDKILSEPVNVSLTMANDNLLKSFLNDEEAHLEDDSYTRQIQDYLFAYREKYSYDSVFLVSAKTNRYYHFDGLDRILTQDNPENVWYHQFLNTDEEYSLNVDNDEAADNSITAFVNCKIRDRSGSIMGIIGVGMKVDSLQAMLKEYDERFHVNACLIDAEGIVQLSSERTGYEHINLFEDSILSEYKESVLGKQDGQQTFWYSAANTSGYVVSQYVSSMKWHLVVRNDMTVLNRQLHTQLLKGIVIIFFIILSVIFTITSVLKKYKTQILKLSFAQKQDYQKLLDQAIEGLYENIFEIDVTHNRGGGEGARRYFAELGMTLDTPLDEVLRVIAATRVKAEYAQGYLDTFLPERVIESYNNGINSLSYDFLILNSDETYRWMRVICRIFYWESDESIRMISYREDIDMEKKRELLLLEKSQRDSMTGLYNKGMTESLMRQILSSADSQESRYTLLMIDIDNFKNVNDQYGHAFGDTVITEFADELKSHFRDTDIVGRVGGDEFAVLITDFGDSAMLWEKMERFCARIAQKDFGQQENTSFTCSIGAAVYPDQGNTLSELFEKADQALYYAKAHGKCSYHIKKEDL